MVLQSKPALIAFFVFLVGPSAFAEVTTVAAAGDTSVTKDAAAGTWTIAAGGATLTLNLDQTRDFGVASLVSPSGRTWVSRGRADTFVRVGAQALPLGQRAAGFTLDDVTVQEKHNGLQLNASFTLSSASLRVVRHYAAVSGSPAFEAWTSFTQSGAGVTLYDVNALQLTVADGRIRWLNGLQGDAADVVQDSAFSLQQTVLSGTQHLGLGATGRSSEKVVPWLAIGSGEDEFFAALMWSGAWSMTVDRSEAGLAVAIGLPPMATSVSRTGPVEGPHAVFGIARADTGGTAAALRTYILDGIRAGRPLTALVTYNTWFTYGTQIDEESMRAEMSHAAALGTELFVIDAGWYPGAGANGPGDFDSGLGNWNPDPARFPNGLRPLRDYAHALGMKFGIWVEPERVNTSVIGARGLNEAWLATKGGSYGSPNTAMICLSDRLARRWLLTRLTDLIDDVQPDYVKWDNNQWVNCDRLGHGHGTTDGNFAQVTGLYGLLASLRRRFPDLLIENVSGGGNRLDLGMLRYSDVAWMDDRTGPSVHVRHNLQGLSAVFPTAYLLSFALEFEGEPLHQSPDLPLFIRSRMAGVLGLCFRSGSFEGDETAALAREIAIYKDLRDRTTTAAAVLLSEQAIPGAGPPWDALQLGASDGTSIVIFAFQSDEGTPTFRVTPVGLAAHTTYEVRSVDTGSLGTATGVELMTDGVDLLRQPASAAHILVITPRRP